MENSNTTANQPKQRNFLLPALVIALLGLSAYQVYETGRLKKQLAELQGRPKQAAASQVLPPRGNNNPPAVLDPMDPSIDPLASIRDMQREMDELLNNRMGSLKQELKRGMGGISARINAGSPEIELTETSEAYEARVAFDNIANVEVKVNVDSSNVLHISGSQKQELAAQPGSGVSFSSSVMSNFERALPLEKPVSSEKLRTSKEGNTLVVIIPKA